MKLRFAVGASFVLSFAGPVAGTIMPVLWKRAPLGSSALAFKLDSD